ncbi:MAG: SMP-30/gluconolactonase/LRE family protein [Candidatus Cybelea sp.]
MSTRLHRFALGAALVTAACSGRWGAPALAPPAPAPPQHAGSTALYVANRWGNSIFVYEPGSDRPSRKIFDGIAAPIALAQDTAGNLFVANSPNRKHGWVSVYAPGATKPSRRISSRITELSLMAVGRSGNLFVANLRGNAVYEYAPGSKTIGRTIAQGVIAALAIAVDDSGYLYVSNCVRCVDPFHYDTITIYAPKSAKPLRTIRTGYHLPGDIAFDANGNAYVDVAPAINVYEKHGTRHLRTLSGAAGRLEFDAAGNLYSAQRKYDNSGGQVFVFPPGATTPSYTITKGIYNPGGIAIDATDNDLYVANSSHNDIAVYPAGRLEPSRTITVATGLENPQALALDGDGNLYAANTYESTVTVYAPGSSDVLRTIVKGIASPSALAFDQTGNLYVANVYGNEGGSEVGGTITVYGPGESKPFLSIVNGVRGANYSLGFDRAQNLYVASGCPYENAPITVYAHASKKLLRTISKGISFPCALALDASDKLYVANVGSNNVVVYPPGGSTPGRTIERRIDYPDGIAIDRPGNLYVTNARGGDGRTWGSVAVYPPGEDDPSRIITRGLTGGGGPGSPVFGPSDELTVVDSPKVVVYEGGGGKPILSIDRGLQAPASPIYDLKGNLYVANQSSSTVVEYASGTNKIIRTIPAAKAYPDALIFAPNGKP